MRCKRYGTETAAAACTVRCSVLAYVATSLRACYAVSGTDLAWVACKVEEGREGEREEEDDVHKSAPLSAYAPAMRCPVLTYRVVIGLCTCCAVCGTEIAYGAVLCDVQD
eukprot:1988898-Rhodomonas_salina.1